MTIIEEKAYTNEISRLAGENSYLRGRLYKYKKLRALLQEVVDKSFYITDFDAGAIQGYKNVLRMMPEEIKEE
jgi:hypothetical protein